jgi:hypothetical protein
LEALLESISRERVRKRGRQGTYRLSEEVSSRWEASGWDLFLPFGIGGVSDIGADWRFQEESADGLRRSWLDRRKGSGVRRELVEGGV